MGNETDHVVKLASNDKNTRRQASIGIARGIIYMALLKSRGESVGLGELCRQASIGLTEMGGFEICEAFKDVGFRFEDEQIKKIVDGDFSLVFKIVNVDFNDYKDLHYEDITIFDLLFPQLLKEE